MRHGPGGYPTLAARPSRGGPKLFHSYHTPGGAGAKNVRGDFRRAQVFRGAKTGDATNGVRLAPLFAPRVRETPAEFRGGEAEGCYLRPRRAAPVPNYPPADQRRSSFPSSFP